MAVSCHISCPKHPNQMSATSVLLHLLVETCMQISGCNRQFVHIVCINFGAPRLIVVILTDGLYCYCICSQYVLHDSSTRRLIQGIPGVNVSILGSHSNGHSKKKKKSVCACVLFWTVSEMEVFHCTGVWIWRPILSLTPAVLRHCMKHVNQCEAAIGRCKWIHKTNCSSK